jgi:hypothetical protein
VKAKIYYLRKRGVVEVGELMEYNRGGNLGENYLCTYGITTMKLIYNINVN